MDRRDMLRTGAIMGLVWSAPVVRSVRLSGTTAGTPAPAATTTTTPALPEPDIFATWPGDAIEWAAMFNTYGEHAHSVFTIFTKRFVHRTRCGERAVVTSAEIDGTCEFDVPAADCLRDFWWDGLVDGPERGDEWTLTHDGIQIARLLTADGEPGFPLQDYDVLLPSCREDVRATLAGWAC